jgi:hypothetical protein
MSGADPSSGARRSSLTAVSCPSALLTADTGTGPSGEIDAASDQLVHIRLDLHPLALVKVVTVRGVGAARVADERLGQGRARRSLRGARAICTTNPAIVRPPGRVRRTGSGTPLRPAAAPVRTSPSAGSAAAERMAARLPRPTVHPGDRGGPDGPPATGHAGHPPQRRTQRPVLPPQVSAGVPTRIGREHKPHWRRFRPPEVAV